LNNLCYPLSNKATILKMNKINQKNKSINRLEILLLKLPSNIFYNMLTFLVPDSRLFKWRPSGRSRLFKVFLLNGKKISNHDGKYLTFKFKKNGKHQYFITDKIELDLCKCDRTNCSTRHRRNCEYIYADDEEEEYFRRNKSNFKCPDCSIYICEGEKYRVIKYKSIYVGKNINYALLKLFMYEIQEKKVSNTCMICNSRFNNIINKRYFINDPPNIFKKKYEYILTEHSFNPPTSQALKLANARLLTHDISDYNSIKKQMKYYDVLIIFMGAPPPGTSNFDMLYLRHKGQLEKYIAPVIHNEDEFNHYISYQKAKPAWFCQYYLINYENERCYQR